MVDRISHIGGSGRTLAERGLRVIDRPAVGAAVQGRWLVHPKDASGVMVEGVEEWSGTGA